MQFAPKITDFRARYICVRKYQRAEFDTFMTFRGPAGMQGCIRSGITAWAVAAVDSAFNTLAQTVLVKNARTLDEMVSDMLKPMLKAWLDDNLPGMVERIVRDEIERVSRGRPSS